MGAAVSPHAAALRQGAGCAVAVRAAGAARLRAHQPAQQLAHLSCGNLVEGMNAEP